MAVLPKQQAILDAMIVQIAGINPTNDDPATGQPYGVDLRDAVFLDRTTLGENDADFVVAILESPEPTYPVPADEEELNRKERWKLLLQGFAKAADDDKPTREARLLKAQVEQRLSRWLIQDNFGRPAFPDESIVGKLINGMSIGQGVVRPPTANVSSTGFFYLPVALQITTDLSDPYVNA